MERVDKEGLTLAPEGSSRAVEPIPQRKLSMKQGLTLDLRIRKKCSHHGVGV